MPPYHWMIRSTAVAAFADKEAPEFVVVQVGDLFVPENFRATASRQDEDDWPDFTNWPELTFKGKMRGSQPVIYDLRIAGAPTAEGARSDDHDDHELRPRAITGEVLREIPLGRLAKAAMLGVAFRLPNDGDHVEYAVPENAKELSGFWYIDTLDSFRVPTNEAAERLRTDAPVFDEPPWQEHMQAIARALRQAEPLTRNRNQVTRNHLEAVAEVYRLAIDDGDPPKKAVSAAFHVSISTAGRWVQRARREGFLGPTQPGRKGEIDLPEPVSE